MRLWQVNVRIPEFAVKGEVVWRVGEQESQEAVFVALQEEKSMIRSIRSPFWTHEVSPR